MQEKLEKVLAEARAQLEAAQSLAETEEIRVKVMGKKGQLTQILRGMGNLSKEEKKEMGMAANKAKAQFEEMLKQRVEMVKEKAKAAKFRAERIDVTEPGVKVTIGVEHPITQVINEIVGIFRSMGYSVYESPEVDTVFNTFDGLNAPEYHPSRDLTDTFYISKDIVLRPHTSSGEVRAEKDLPLPYKIVIPGRCFRCDTPDATHSPTFHQVEMMVIGEGFFPLLVTVRTQLLSLILVRGDTARVVLLLATVGFSQGPLSMVGHSGADSRYFL